MGQSVIGWVCSRRMESSGCDRMTCTCSCGCTMRSAKATCWRCSQGRHRMETQNCQCPTCTCVDANRLHPTAVAGANILMCNPCAAGRHNLLEASYA